jgi:hypothetical protein
MRFSGVLTHPAIITTAASNPSNLKAQRFDRLILVIFIWGLKSMV